MNLTANFTLSEMTKSDTALRLGLENQPDEQQLAALKVLAEKVLQPVRDHYGKGVKVNSALRTLPVNRAIGSSDNSHHVRGMAADIEIPGVANADLAQYIVDNLDFFYINYTIVPIQFQDYQSAALHEFFPLL